jgi:hypothetical protein
MRIGSLVVLINWRRWWHGRGVILEGRIPWVYWRCGPLELRWVARRRR